ncbi:MAG TPA: hypothetical protein VGT41_04875 [Candidatus Babeliales bacterium]|nr:hypothetical protein [Candidatus Babeliales bacterium]
MKTYLLLILMFISTPCMLLGRLIDERPCCGTRVDIPLRPYCCDCCGDTDQRSHSFMFTRPLTQQLNRDQALWHAIIHTKEHVARGAADITVAYRESLHSDRIARYFLPVCNTTVLVSGDCNFQDTHTRNIRAEWLGLPNNFRGRFSIKPEQKQAGVILEYNQDIGAIIDSALFNNSWINIQAPLVWVQNNMRLEQFDVINSGSENPKDIVQALRQPGWDYAKICGKKSHTGLAEVNFKFGRTFLANDFFLVSYYSLCRLPSANKQNPEFIFDPVVGNNQHFGFGAGVNFQILLQEECDRFAFCFFTNLESTFFVRNMQTRTFDLKGKPWSRYLLLTHIDGPLGNSTPGVNVLTREGHVHPYNMVDFSTGVRFKWGQAEFELGFNIWGHGNERIELRCPFKSEWGIAGIVTATGCQTPQPAPAPRIVAVTASDSTICTQADNDIIIDPDTKEKQSIFVPIRESDLDLNSGMSQAALNYIIHATAGYIYEGKNFDGLCNAGIYFEFIDKNGALPTAGFWAKIGASF